MRLIDADALIIAIKRKAPISDAMRAMWFECLEEVKHAPTIKSERKTGKWIRIVNPNSSQFDPGSEYIYQCSECGGHGHKNYKYCPWCNKEMVANTE